MRVVWVTALILCSSAIAFAAASPARTSGDNRPPASVDTRVTFPSSVEQGSLVIGKVPPDSLVRHAGRPLRVTSYGTVVFGIGRDAGASMTIEVTPPSGTQKTVTLNVTPRDWPIERVNGVPPGTVKPAPALAARIAREQALVTEARLRDDPRTDFTQAFIWPVEGRISGRFGNQRVYNGSPGAAHSGMDIAAVNGTPVKAPAAGVVTFTGNLYLTGGTVLLDHGHGVSSNFLHLSRMDVAVGDSVQQGEVIGAVGATGRATGPHLHWGMNWLDVRIDPLLVLERAR